MTKILPIKGKLQSSQMSSNISEIITEFVNLIDNDKVYDLKELKQIITSVYKTKNNASKPTVDKKSVVVDSSSDDEDKPKKLGRPSKAVKTDKNGNIKEKRKPSAYNIFVKKTIEELKKENPSTSAKELMGLAAMKWKELSDDEKNSYKTD